MKYDLINDDCMNALKDIPTASIDMILCDLPYGTTANKWDVIIPIGPLWNEYERVIKENGAIVLFRYEWVWVKENGTGFLNARRMPLKLTENILVFYKKLPTYNPQGVIELENPVMMNRGSCSKNYRSVRRRYMKTKKNFPKNLLYFARDKEKLHPTQKPVALLEYLINTYTNEGDLVLDNCMGSGSTGVACVNTNRDFIGIEMDKDYFEMPQQRISNALCLTN